MATGVHNGGAIDGVEGVSEVEFDEARAAAACVHKAPSGVHGGFGAAAHAQADLRGSEERDGAIADRGAGGARDQTTKGEAEWRWAEDHRPFCAPR